MIRSLVRGYFAPEEGPPWGLSFPLLDIIARRDLPRVITLSEIVVEVEQSATDAAPYVGVISPANEFARLVLFNEGWSDVKRATLEYDVLGFKEPDSLAINQLVKAKHNGGYKHSVSVGPFEDFASVSLAEGFAKAVPDLRMYEYAFKEPPWEKPDGKKRRPQRMPAGYAAWIKSNAARVHDQERSPGEGLWIVGRLTVEAVAPGFPPLLADVVAPVAMYAPSGLGGGGIGYNLKQPIPLRSDGQSYVVRRSIGYLLDQDTKTFRGVFPLTVERTSRHRFRVLLLGDGGRELYASEWVDAHVVVPRLSKRAIDWVVKTNYTGRPPFRGIR